MAGSIIGGIFGAIGSGKEAKAAKQAAAAQAEAARIGAETQREMFDASVQLGNPWRHSGQNALGALSYELGLGPLPEFEVAPSVIGANDPKALSQLYGRTGTTPAASGTTAVPTNALAAAAGGMTGGATHPMLQPSAEALSGLPEASRSYFQNPANFQFPMEDDAGYPRWMRDPSFQSFFQTGGAMGGGGQQAPAPAANAPAAPQGTFKYRGFQETPGFQFQLDEGQKAINRSLAARGGLLSGAAVKEGMRFGQGLANQEYSNHLARLAALSGVGGGFAQQAGQNAITTGNSIAGTLQSGAANQGNALMQAGMARASGYNALGAGLGGAINSGIGFGSYKGWF